MTRSRTWGSAVVALCLGVGALAADVRPVAAEWFTDLYAGLNATESQHFSLDGNIQRTETAGFVDNVQFEKSFTVGGRAGYWLESFKFFGVGLDVSYFRPDIKAQTATGKGTIADSRGVLFGVPLNVFGATPVKLPQTNFGVVAVGFDLMLRWPLLTSESFPRGQVQPYITAGPAIYIPDLERFHPSKFEPSLYIGRRAASLYLGPKVAGGVTWFFAKNIGLFGEYRYTYSRPSADFGNIVFKTHLSTHHVLGGISVRY